MPSGTLLWSLPPAGLPLAALAWLGRLITLSSQWRRAGLPFPGAHPYYRAIPGERAVHNALRGADGTARPVEPEPVSTGGGSGLVATSRPVVQYWSASWRTSIPS